MRFIIILGITFLLISCTNGSTANYYTQTVDSWRGGNENSLTKQWGAPDMRIKSPNGSNVLVYKTQSYHANTAAYSPAVGVNFNGQGKPIIVTSPNQQAMGNGRREPVVTCVTVFETNAQGQIIGSQSKGTCYGNQSFANQRANSSR